jgi:hypothetical protein
MENLQQQRKTKEFFEEVIPEDINEMVGNLNEYRKH